MGNTSLDIVELIRQREGELVNGKEQLLGKGIIMPNNPANSGSRKLLQSTQAEQILPIYDSEAPLYQTGYENEIGKHSSTYITADTDLRVVQKITKYNFNDMDNHHYYLIVQRADTLEYDIIERKSYQYVTEAFGLVYNNDYLDSVANIPNSIIPKHEVIKKSISFDWANNRCDGVNLTTAYIAMESSKEDSITIAQSAADKMTAPLVISVPIKVNDNDIPLNLYGDAYTYKVIPDIGELVKDGILCGLRREDREHMLYSQTYDRLKSVMMSDEKYYARGKVIDIDVYTNNYELLDSKYYQQLKFYHDERVRMYTEIAETVEILKHEDVTSRFSHDLSRLYAEATKVIRGAAYTSKSKQFSNIVLNLTVLEDSELTTADKITNRYGGKGCISKIVPDNLMPRLDNGEIVELIYTPASVINRSNLGLLLEQSVNFIGARLVEEISRMRDHCTDPYTWAKDAMATYIEFVSMVSETYGNHLFDMYSILPKETLLEHINSVTMDKYPMIPADPVSEIMDVNKLIEIYKRFPVEPYTVTVPMKDSRGNIRYIETRRKMVCAKQYIWRLKQYSEDKLSAVSLSSTNIRGENSKSSSKKMNKTLHSKTCIRFGNMETGNLLHLSPEVVVSNLMVNSLAPKARRNFMDLLDGDVFDVDIRLDETCTNRAVEIVNTKLKSIGLQLVFNKIPKQPMPMMTKMFDMFERDANKPYQMFDRLGDTKSLQLFDHLDKVGPLDLFETNKYELFDRLEDVDPLQLFEKLDEVKPLKKNK